MWNFVQVGKINNFSHRGTIVTTGKPLTPKVEVFIMTVAITKSPCMIHVQTVRLVQICLPIHLSVYKHTDAHILHYSTDSSQPSIAIGRNQFLHLVNEKMFDCN